MARRGRSLIVSLLLAAAPGAFGQGGSVKLIAYDAKGRVMDLPRFLAVIGRADGKTPPEEADAALLAASPDGLASQKPALKQMGAILLLSWEGLPRVTISLPWPIADDGFSTVWLDKGGPGYADGDVIYLNEEIAATQYRLFREAWTRHTTEGDPPYEPGPKAKKLAQKAAELMTKAGEAKGGPKRAAAFDKALQATALAWEKMLFEHGLQIAHTGRRANTLRFGLTLDSSVARRVGDREWLVEAIKRSGTNWVRLVFRPNPGDFTYSAIGSFNEYDAFVRDLRAAGIRIMGCVLETTQWPAGLTPEVYAARTRNMVLHYRGQINSWEVGSEINGDWLGGSKTPLSTDEVFRIYSAAAAEVKTLEPGLETVATLYWWDGTAPDEQHSLFGWLSRYAPRGFGRNLDVVSLSLQPEDNPVGTAFERIFERVQEVLPEKRVMLGSFGYVEGEDVKGYWWLHPSDVDGARKDLAILYTTAACAFPRSVCGGFWWQALDQMLPARHKSTDLFRIYRETLQQLGR